MLEARRSTMPPVLAHPWSVLRSLAACLLLSSVGLVFLATPTAAQSLDDFRRAAAADGVEVIPFDDLRREAASIADEVDRAKTASKWNYSTYEKQKDNLLKAKEQKQKEIEDVEDFIREMRSKYDEVDVSSYEEDLSQRREELEEIDDKIDDLDDELEDGAEAWKRLWNARGGLREIFDDAKDELDDVRDDPEDYLGHEPSEEELEQLERYLDVIEDEIEAGERTHKEQEEGAKGTEEKFRDLIDKDEL